MSMATQLQLAAYAADDRKRAIAAGDPGWKKRNAEYDRKLKAAQAARRIEHKAKVRAIWIDVAGTDDPGALFDAIMAVKDSRNPIVVSILGQIEDSGWASPKQVALLKKVVK